MASTKVVFDESMSALRPRPIAIQKPLIPSESHLFIQARMVWGRT